MIKIDNSLSKIIADSLYQLQLNGTGFVKISETTISYDNSTYYKSGDNPTFGAITGTSLKATNLTSELIKADADGDLIEATAGTDYIAPETITAKTSTYTVLTTDSFLTGSGTFTFTLPTAVGITGKNYTFKNIGTGVITIDGNASETIDGGLTYLIRSTNGFIKIISDGANWLILGEKPPRLPSVGSSYWKNISLGGVCPGLEPEEVANNGQVLNDAQSVFNGVTMPDTNGVVSGIKRFRRGSTTSGTTGGSGNHSHSMSGTAYCGTGSLPMQVAGTPTGGYSTLPSYIEGMEVTRVK